MAQAELFDIDSPCISVCEMDDKGYCKGCLRNRTERQFWHAMNDEQKRQVLRLLFVRRHKQKLALAKLARQATIGDKAIVFSQMTFLENPLAENNLIENRLAENALTMDTPIHALPSEPIIHPGNHPLQDNQASNTTITEPPPKPSPNRLKNTDDIKEQNWDFFAVLEQSLQ